MVDLRSLSSRSSDSFSSPSSTTRSLMARLARRGKYDRDSPPSSLVRFAMVESIGVVGPLLLPLVLVLAELVLASRLRCMSCGFAPLFSSWPSWLQPSAANEPLRISANDGTFEVTSPVACHIPSGGFEWRKDCRNELVRRRPGESVVFEDGAAPWLAVVLSVFWAGCRDCSVGTDAMGESAGNGSGALSVGLAMLRARTFN
jgi:hypothetical protein